jgi:hypothetical protein
MHPEFYPPVRRRAVIASPLARGTATRIERTHATKRVREPRRVIASPLARGTATRIERTHATKRVRKPRCLSTAPMGAFETHPEAFDYLER